MPHGSREGSFLGDRMCQVGIDNADSEACSLPCCPLPEIRRSGDGDAPRPFLRGKLQCRGQAVLVPAVVDSDPSAEVSEHRPVIATVVVHCASTYLGQERADVPRLCRFVTVFGPKNRSAIMTPYLRKVIRQTVTL